MITDFLVDSKISRYPVSDLAKFEWKEFAMYTVESRAIPNLIDGMKPVNRFYLYSSIVNSKTEFKKVSAIAGIVSDYGYNHAEASAENAGQLMVAEWYNNVCLIEGSGAFGSRMITSAAAPRYTKTRLHKNFSKYIKDIDLSPEHDDPEHVPPAFYIPVIPLVLVNGAKGIATGFATNILPRDPKDVIRACKEYVTKGKIGKKIAIKFPKFTGEILYDAENDKHFCNGTFEKTGKTVLNITEIPYGIDRESYINILDKIEDTGDIVGYDELCDKDGFKFVVKLKQVTSAKWDDEKLIKQFKLSKPLSENLTVIDQDGKLRIYKDERQLVKDFCDYRMTILQKRIDLRIKEHIEEIRWYKVKMQFVESVIDSKIIFKKRKRDDVGKQILEVTSAIEDDVDRLLRINIMSLTSEMVAELSSQIKSANGRLKYWKNTTSKDQFIDDLGEI